MHETCLCSSSQICAVLYSIAVQCNVKNTCYFKFNNYILETIHLINIQIRYRLRISDGLKNLQYYTVVIIL